MTDRAGDVGGKIVGCMTDGRKRDNHEVHEQKDKFAVDQTAEDRTLDEDTKFSAGDVVNRRSAECDSEMAKKANRSRCPSHLTGVPPKDATRDCLQNSKGSGPHQAEADERLGEIEDTGQ